jgi:NADP-dependent 3-hydroxy acid dehydrogenase YdfG
MNVIAALRTPPSAPPDLTFLQPASRLLITKCDVTDINTTEAAVQETVKKIGKVDWVENNAG